MNKAEIIKRGLAGSLSLLSNEDLISLLGVSKSKTISVLNYINDRERLSYDSLSQIVGESLAMKMVAIKELFNRKPNQNVIIKKYEDALPMLSHIRDLDHEEFWVIYMNNAHKVITTFQLGKGGINLTAADHRIALKKALEIGANAIIIAHNHPSGNLEPSPQDDAVVRSFQQGCMMLNISFLDSLIITNNDEYSYNHNNRL